MTEKRNLKQYVYNAILEDIFELRLKPGDILNEKTLVERFGCSKSPVREALLTLCNENVLRSMPRYGYEVIRLTSQDIREMMELRMTLETGFLQRYYKTITEEQIAQLEEINRKCMDDRYNAWEHWEYNMQFHQQLMDFWNNAYASGALQICLLSQKRAYVQSYWEKDKNARYSIDTRHHEAIIKALREKDLEALMEAFRKDYHDFGGPDSFTLS
ncbi:MAG: GntR family transcriptional regulator [Solobacterium sp.]|nr:GntR family transcriptional regulator [Solobacterium sp.]MBQ6355577.1 GntR family transcriptional regulator [Solobacterium sp.]MBQ6533436.1 GntR family transcriptional regulator [Solobacterium sp.]MBR0213959.1 GntR family transcriptional regulator [Solobacterium sp.]